MSFLKHMSNVQAKKDVAARMTNVTCSTAIFPEEFEVESSPKMPLRRNNTAGLATFPADGEAGIPSPTNTNRKEASIAAESCVSEDSNAEWQDGHNNAVAPLSHFENQAIVQQVHYNVELLKHRLFSLLDMLVLPMEEEESLRRIQELQQLLHPTTPQSQSFALSEAASVAGAAVSGTPTPRRGGSMRPTSATRRTPSHTESAQLTPANTSKTLQVSTTAVDTYFRYAFEEVALRWNSLQNRPFSLRAFHQVAKEQIKLRESALQAKGVAEEHAKRSEAEISAMQFRLENHNVQHAQTIQKLLTENRVLRQRIMDLQMKMKLDEPIPQLFHPKDEPEAEGVSRDGSSGDGPTMIDPMEKHYETLNRRLTEECALLTHTLEQRNNVVKALHTELQTTKLQATSLKDDFRRYVQEQESLDSEFRKTFAQNEAAMESAKRECGLAVKRAAEMENQFKEVAAKFGGMEDKIRRAESEKADAHAERDHLRTMTEQLVHEAETAKEQLVEERERCAVAVAEAQSKLQVALDRIHELENDGTREKLDVALKEVAALQDKTTKLQRAVESRDKQIQTLKSEHKAEINKMEETVAGLKQDMVTAAAKSEELLIRERQKGVELAERKVKEAQAHFAVERQTLTTERDAAYQLQQDMAFEVMLFHRQSTVLELFLRQHLNKDQLRELAKLNLRRDIRNSVLEAGGESDEENGSLRSSKGNALPSRSEVVLGVHTPRTRLFFGQHRLFDPEEVQSRLTEAGEAMEHVSSSRTEAHGLQHNEEDTQPTIPRGDAKAPAALLLKSKLTLEFLQSLHDRLASTSATSLSKSDRDSSPSSPQRQPQVLPSFLSDLDVSERQAKLLQMSLSSNSRVREALAATFGQSGRIPLDDASDMATFSGRQISDGSVASGVGGDHNASSALLALASPMRILNAEQRMIVEDMKSQLVMSQLHVKALEDEVFALQSGETLSAGVQTSFVSSPRKIRSAGRSRPGSAARSYGDGSSEGGEEVVVANDGIVRSSTMSTAHRGSVAALTHSASKRSGARSGSVTEIRGSHAFDEGSNNGSAADEVVMESSTTMPPTPLLIRGASIRQQSSMFGFPVRQSASTLHHAPSMRDDGTGSEKAFGSVSDMLPLMLHADGARRDSSSTSRDHDGGGNNATSSITNEFPGMHHAGEHYDLFQSYFDLRAQLSALVDVCTREAERAALDPDDLVGAQELLHAKFSVFRAVETQNTLMLSRLHHKKEDIMRRKEEELERVLGAMQNISRTHPKESAKLLRVAKSASRQRQVQRLTSSNYASLGNATDSGPGDGAGGGNSMCELSAVVVRPVSQQSLRRLTPIPTDVAVSGAPALMSLRSRAASANGSRKKV